MATKAKTDEDGWIILVIAGVGLVMFFAFLTIPEGGSANPIQIISLAFSNGIFVGWADDIAAAVFSDTASEKSQMLSAYRNAILTGERQFPIAVLIFTLLGTFLSVGGVIAVLMARSADSFGQAFAFGFFAEIAEGIAWHAGYFATVGHTAISPEEIGVTLVVAVIMGFVAMGVYSKALKTA